MALALAGIFLIDLEARSERHAKAQAEVEEAAKQARELQIRIEGQAIIDRHNRVSAYAQSFPSILENIARQERIGWLNHSNSELQQAEVMTTYSNALVELDAFSSNYPAPTLYPKKVKP